MKECSICGNVRNGRTVLVKSGSFVKHQNNYNWLDILGFWAGVVFTRKITEEIKWDKESRIFLCKSCSSKHKMKRFMSYVIGNIMKFLVGLFTMSLFAPLAMILIVAFMGRYETIPVNIMWCVIGASTVLLPIVVFIWKRSFRWGFNKGKWREVVHERADRFELI